MESVALLEAGALEGTEGSMNPEIEAFAVAEPVAVDEAVLLKAAAVDEASALDEGVAVSEAVAVDTVVSVGVPLELELAVDDELAVCVPPAEPDGARDLVGVALDDDVALDEDDDVDVADAVAVDRDDLEVVNDSVAPRVLDIDDESEDEGEEVTELEGDDDAGEVGEGMGTHAGVIPPVQLQVPATLVSVKGPPKKPAAQDQE